MYYDFLVGYVPALNVVHEQCTISGLRRLALKINMKSGVGAIGQSRSTVNRCTLRWYITLCTRRILTDTLQ